MSKEIRIVAYAPGMSDACLELERGATHDGSLGKGLRMGFRRPTFHARSQRYDNWAIRVAMSGDRVVGAGAMAFKSVVFRKEKTHAAYFYDMLGRTGEIAAQLRTEAERAHIRLRYCWCPEGDTGSRKFGELIGAKPSGRAAVLAWPVFRPMKKSGSRFKIPPADAHALTHDKARPFDFFCAPCTQPVGQLGSFRIDGAACSVWSNDGMLEEALESVSWGYRFRRAWYGLWPARRGGMPPLPEKGKPLRSWVVHDLSAVRAGAAVELLSLINNDALERGVENISIVVPDGERPWLAELRAAAPRGFAPLTAHRLMLFDSRGPVDPLGSVAVDVRDL